jgi:tetratricopeptide (TPR) repeat protein
MSSDTEKAMAFLDQLGLTTFKKNEQVVLAMEMNAIFSAKDLEGITAADLHEAGFPTIPAKKMLQAAQSAAQPPPAPAGAGSLAKAEAAQSKAEASLDKFGFGLDVADGVLSALSVVPIPGMGALCGKLRSAIGAARNVQDMAEDALELTESMLELGKYLVDLGKLANQMPDDIKGDLTDQLAKLSKVIGDMEEAIQKFGKKGFLKAMLQAGKSAKRLAKVDKKKQRIVDAIDRIVQRAQLSLQMEMKERQFKSEQAVWTKIEEKLKASGGDAGDDDDVSEAAGEILANPQEVRAVAKNAGLSEDVFKAEMGEMKEELRAMGQSIENMMGEYHNELSEQLGLMESNLTSQMDILKQQMADREKAAAERADKAEDSQQKMMMMLQQALLDKDTSKMGKKEVDAHDKLVEAQVASNKGDKTKAAQLNKAAGKLHKSAESEVSRGQELLEQEKYKPAIKAFKKATTLDPGMAIAWAFLGQALDDSRNEGSEKEAQQVVNAYREAVRLDPSNSVAWHNLAYVLHMDLDDCDEAEEAYQGAIKARPRYQKAHYHLALCLVELGREDEAADAYRAAIKINPRYTSALSNLSILLYQDGDAEGAVEHMRQALKVTPNDVELNANLCVFIKNGLKDYHAAAEQYLATIKVDPTSAKHHYNLALVYEDKLDQPVDAERHYLAALKIEPDHAECRYWFAKMLGEGLGRWDEAAKHMLQSSLDGEERADDDLAEYEANAST